MAQKKTLTDSEFLEGLRNGNNEILNVLYKKFFNVVLKHIVNNNGTEQEAKDIYQETIIVLYENVKKTDFVLSCQLQTYIYSISKRLWLKQIGKQSHLVKLSDNDNGDGAVNVSEEIEDYERKEKDFARMNEQLQNLGEPCKTIITDFYLNKMNMDDIADKFGYTNADNAKNQKYKCLQRLKKMFLND